MRLQSAARARSVDGTVARGKMADAKNRCETRNVTGADSGERLCSRVSCVPVFAEG